MQAVYAEVDGGALAGLDDFLLYLAAYLGHNLLDAGGMDATVGHELMQGQTGYLAAHGVESAQHYGFGGVVDDDLDACGGLEGAYVAAFAAYDTAFNLVRIDVEHCHRVFYGGLGGHALYRLHHDALGFFIGRHLGLIHYVVDV